MGMPTLKEWERDGFACKDCGRETVLEIHSSDATHPGGVRCSVCKLHNGFLRKEKNIDKRPMIKPGKRQQVWEAWGNRCVHCGLSLDELQALGVMRTVQHAPPYCVVKTDESLLPYCDWCQQDSTTAMKRRTALLKRITKPSTRKALENLYNSIEINNTNEYDS